MNPARYTTEVPYRSSLCLMVSMVRDGVVSPSELVDAHLRQIERRNPQLNAFTEVFADEAREDARRREQQAVRGEPLGLLHGVPFTVKDSFDVSGHPTLAGSRFRTGHRAAHDAAAVALLRAQGAIPLGKTNTPELLSSYETDNFVTGRTNNPWDLERTPGGSSGGEAAAIAGLCSPAGIGSDGGASIRLPAHFCGIAGLKPTPGRIPASGHFPSLGYPLGLLTCAGPMARTAEDLRLWFSVMAGYDAEDPFSVPVPLREPAAAGVRIGIWDGFYSVPVDPAIRAAVRAAAALLSGLGFAVDEFRPRGLERAPNAWAVLFSQWPAAAKRKLLEGREAEAHWTATETLPAEDPTPAEVLNQLAARDRMRAALIRQMEETSVVVMPACGITAFRHRERRWDVEGKNIGMFQILMPAVVANVLGLPAVVVPMAHSPEGLPIGIQLMGRPFADELLLDLAVRLEEARGPWIGP